MISGGTRIAIFMNTLADPSNPIDRFMLFINKKVS